MNRKSSFEDLECSKICRDLRQYVANIVCLLLPPDERFRLKDQIIRASRSVTANIAEGYGRYHYLDEAKFLSNSRGSLHEVLDHSITAHDEGFISDDMLQVLREMTDHALRLLNGYRAYVIRCAKNS